MLSRFKEAGLVLAVVALGQAAKTQEMHVPDNLSSRKERREFVQKLNENPSDYIVPDSSTYKLFANRGSEKRTAISFDIRQTKDKTWQILQTTSLQERLGNHRYKFAEQVVFDPRPLPISPDSSKAVERNLSFECVNIESANHDMPSADEERTPVYSIDIEYRKLSYENGAPFVLLKSNAIDMIVDRGTSAETNAAKNPVRRSGVDALRRYNKVKQDIYNLFLEELRSDHVEYHFPGNKIKP